MIPQHYNGNVITRISGAQELIRRGLIGLIRDVLEKELWHNICPHGVQNEQTLLLETDFL